MYHTESEERFWRSVRRDPHFTCDDIRRKYRDLDRRLQGMEQLRHFTEVRSRSEVQGSGVIKELRELRGQ